MKITVLNGSPKGAISATMQYVHYIQKVFPQHELKIINITNKIKKIEKDAAVFEGILDEIRSSDGVLWASPVYYFLVPANYKRFIELVSEKGAEDAFKNKPTAVLTTSVKFYDHTAHNYLNGICDDLNMHYLGSYSADMMDLKKPEEGERLRLFAENYFLEIENKTRLPKCFMPVTWRNFKYTPSKVKDKIDTGSKKILVVTDSEKNQTNLMKMVKRFSASFSSKIEVINLHDVDIKGSCLGCIQCGYDNHCQWEDKDGYVEFFNTHVKTADILVFAGTIKDRYLSSKWKCFFDRSFFNNHVPALIGKQVGFIISGPLTQIPNLRQILEAYAEFQRCNPVGFITDENGDSAKIDNSLQGLAGRLVRFAERRFIKPPTFLSVGGMKVLRDEAYGRLRFIFRADYVAYKKLGIFDFPQKNYKSRIQNAVMMLFLKLPAFRKELNRRMIKEMVKPLQKVVECK